MKKCLLLCYSKNNGLLYKVTANTLQEAIDGSDLRFRKKTETKVHVKITWHYIAFT